MAYKTFEVDSILFRYPSPRTVDKIMKWSTVDSESLAEVSTAEKLIALRPFAEEIVLECVVNSVDKEQVQTNFDVDWNYAFKVFEQISTATSEIVTHKNEVESESLKS